MDGYIYICLGLDRRRREPHRRHQQGLQTLDRVISINQRQVFFPHPSPLPFLINIYISNISSLLLLELLG